MKIPWVFHAAAGSQALPLLAALRFGLRLPAPRGWVVAWAAVALLADGLGLYLALQGRNNHWINYVVTPVGACLLVYALSRWLPDGLLRLTYLAGIPLFAVTWGLLVLLVENTRTFSLVAGPLNALVLLVAGLGLLFRRLRDVRGSLLRHDWFWVAVGVALRYGSDSAMQPFALLYAGSQPQLVYSALQVKAAVDIVASFVIAGGILCPSAPTPSGGSSSRPGSPSASW